VRSLAWVTGAVVALAVSLGAHFVVGVVTLVDTCGVSDTGSEHPAEVSAQGWVCGAGADTVWQVPGAWFLLGSAVLAALLAVTVARTSWGGVRRSVGAVAALVLVPLLAGVALVLPPDTCTDEQRRDHPAYDCETQPEG
jgi:hypothetical protein